MISRIYVSQGGTDSRENAYVKSWGGLGLSGKIKNVSIVDCYTILGKFSKQELGKISETLTNPQIEKYSLNKITTEKKWDYAVEIGFLPGVTDNVGHTTRETILDLLHTKSDVSVYTSKVFLISGNIKKEDANTIASSLHNPLIEKSTISRIKGGKILLPLKVPRVVLKKGTSFIRVPLNVSDKKLEEIGKVGILDGSGKRRGPLALTLPYMKAIQNHFAKLQRQPTDIELESIAQTWSEHCKHTIFANSIDDIKEGLYKTYIKGATNIIRKEKAKRPARPHDSSGAGGDFCVSVFSDNSGGIVFDKDFLITHKVETHNSPSALDPFGGAITGIGGVNRDAMGFGLGAKPVANTYGFCFSYPDDKRALFRDSKMTQRMLPPARIAKGVIKGINSGGNCSGIPTLNGFVKYDDRYRGKPLVFAGTVGLIPRTLPNGKLSHQKKAKVGDYIVMAGGRVGADGIHGATFSSTTMDATSPATAVQIGDPITQKKMSDAIVKEARDMGLYNSITDDGAGGLSCSVAEMAKECGGAKVDLEKVPLKYANLEPWQIWISESQERMTLSVPKKNWKTFQNLMESRGVEATVIGEFIKSPRCIVNYKGKKIMDVSMEFLHNGLPKEQLQTQKVVQEYEKPKMPAKYSYAQALYDLLKEENTAGFSYISEQYDHEVQAGSVLKPLSGSGRINTDAQVFRPVLDREVGAVLTSATYPSYGDISTYHMAGSAIDTAVRNAICAGASLDHLAILDNFCWCSSKDKTRLAQLVDAVKSCYDYSVGYGTPFISGKDSMFNDFKGYDEKGKPIAISVPPTLLISAVGVVSDIYKTVSPEFKHGGDMIYLLGETKDELGASEFYKLLARKEKSNNIGNDVPKVDFKKNKKVYQALEQAIKRELVASAISVSSGGLAITLAKASVGGMLGCNVSIAEVGLPPTGGSPTSAIPIDVKLFSETQGRIVVSVSPKNAKAFEKIMKNTPRAKIGKVTNNNKFVITENKKKIINTDVKKLHSLYHSFSNRMK